MQPLGLARSIDFEREAKRIGLHHLLNPTSDQRLGLGKRGGKA